MANHGKSYDDYEMTFFNGMAGMGETITNSNLDVYTLAQSYAKNVVKIQVLIISVIQQQFGDRKQQIV